MSGLQKPNIGGPGGTAAGTTFSDAAPPHLGANVQSALATVKKSGQSATLYVDPAGSDGSAVRGSIIDKFNTIQAAITAALVGDVLAIAPGTYTESPVLKAGIALEGSHRQSVIIDGDVLFVPTDAIDEFAGLKSLTVTGDTLLDGTGKTGGQSVLFIEDASGHTGTVIGRAGLQEDGLWFKSIDLPESDGDRWNITLTDGLLVSDESDLGNIVSHGDAFISCRRGIIFGTINQDGNGPIALIQMQVVGNVLVQPGSTGPFQEARRTIFYGDVSGNVGTTWNAYDCTILGTSGAFGTGGTINRNDGPLVGASSSTDGRTGLVPTPFAGQQDTFLRGDGQWADPGLPSHDTGFTSDATPTAIFTKTLDTQTTYVFETTVVGLSDDGAHRAVYKRKAMVYRLNGGAVLDGTSQVIGTDAETDAGLDAAFAVSGNTVQLLVTGLAQNFSWDAKTSFQSVNSGPA